LGFLVVPHFSSAIIFIYWLHKPTISDENALPKPYSTAFPAIFEPQLITNTPLKSEDNGRK